MYVTHDQTEAMSMADQVVLLREGRVEQVATPFDIYRTPRTQFAAQFIGSSRMNMLRIERGCIAGSEISVNAPAAAVYLGLRPEDVFTAEMLAEAMEESSAAFELALEQQQAAGEGKAKVAKIVFLAAGA